MNNLFRPIIAIVILFFVIAGMYFLGSKSYNYITNMYVRQGINMVYQDILNKVLADNKTNMTIPYTDKDGNEHKLEVLIINAKLLNQENK